MRIHIVSIFIAQLVSAVFGKDDNFTDLAASTDPVMHSHTITKTWNDQPTDVEIQVNFSVALKDGKQHLLLQVDAPFFDDPKAPDAPTEEPFPGLWDYEVVEAFFLGENDEYLEIELSPSGHYILLYLAGYRNDTEKYLPLRDFTTEHYITSQGENRWTGNAFIPGEYFPKNISKFNAYAIHLSGENRTYMSLFPVTDGAISEPDFHYLEAFQPVSFQEEKFPEYLYKLDRTWDGNRTEDNVEIFLNFEQTENLDMRISIDAPFYNDPLAPEAPTTDPFPGLWNYEVVEAFFLGNDDNYLEIELSPSEHYLLLYLAGYRNDTGKVLPINDYNATIDNVSQRWKGEAIIPGKYFPCNVTKFNAYAIHKSNENRRYMSLFPVLDGSISEPDFHYLEAFAPIKFDDEFNSEECATQEPQPPSKNGARLKTSTFDTLLQVVIAVVSASASIFLGRS